jgi:branched-chain amino acid transport system substrate-binding protein
MPNKTFFIARAVTYLFILGVVGAGAWYVYPLLVERQAVTATVVLSAPLALESSTVVQQSIQLALEETEYRAGDISILLTVVDDGDETGAWVEASERQNAIAAASEPTTIAYLGPLNSGAAKISMPILNEAGIVQISPSNTWPGLTKAGFLPGEPGIFYPTGKSHYLRTTPTDDLQGPAGAQWARELGFGDVFVVNDSDAYGIGIANLFEREATKLGIRIVGSQGITADPASYQPVGDAIINSGASLMYYGGITPNGGPELLRYIREQGATTTFMGPDGIFEQDFIQRAGTSSEGAYITAVGAPPDAVKTPQARAFIAAYKARFGGEPDAFGAFAYDATKVLVAAITRVGSVNRELVLKEMQQARAQSGVFGTWGFDERGDTTLQLMSGNYIQGGDFVFTKVLSAE